MHQFVMRNVFKLPVCLHMIVLPFALHCSITCLKQLSWVKEITGTISFNQCISYWLYFSQSSLYTNLSSVNIHNSNTRITDLENTKLEELTIGVYVVLELKYILSHNLAIIPRDRKNTYNEFLMNN